MDRRSHGAGTERCRKKCVGGIQLLGKGFYRIGLRRRQLGQHGLEFVGLRRIVDKERLHRRRRCIRRGQWTKGETPRQFGIKAIQPGFPGIGRSHLRAAFAAALNPVFQAGAQDREQIVAGRSRLITFPLCGAVIHRQIGELRQEHRFKIADLIVLTFELQMMVHLGNGVAPICRRLEVAQLRIIAAHGIKQHRSKGRSVAGQHLGPGRLAGQVIGGHRSGGQIEKRTIARCGQRVV